MFKLSDELISDHQTQRDFEVGEKKDLNSVSVKKNIGESNEKGRKRSKKSFKDL